jgi:hypothetical protein
MKTHVCRASLAPVTLHCDWPVRPNDEAFKAVNQKSYLESLASRTDTNVFTCTLLEKFMNMQIISSLFRLPARENSSTSIVIQMIPRSLVSSIATKQQNAREFVLCDSLIYIFLSTFRNFFSYCHVSIKQLISDACVRFAFGAVKLKTCVCHL